MDKKLQKFIDEGILFYPSQQHYQILYSEEITTGDYQEPKVDTKYWLRDEDFSNSDYEEFVKKQKELYIKRINEWLEYQKNI